MLCHILEQIIAISSIISISISIGIKGKIIDLDIIEVEVVMC
jgi:hypothetical protein